jgi:pyroglutamyl-peptidase
MSSSPSVLVTGFEVFGDNSENPTEILVNRLKGNVEKKKFKGIHTRVLPVTHQASNIINSLLPNNYEYVIQLGLHGLINDFALERIAINIDDFRIPDNSGVQTQDRPIDPKAPLAYMTPLPIYKIESALKDISLPCHISYSAGTYLCNHIYFTTLNFIHMHNLNTQAIFVHVPSRDHIDLDLQYAGLQTILRSLGCTIL